ncbi:nitronate monooxygenase [Paraburkholderia sp. NMBU_R16]|uniref:NAD(P)H-dependent flavin oxidoreductase n=1 Tax=Paraburkholderia sp. NMBU_R16 TaxID=2698676 RepID=UPI001564806C|nr:nitronate monooxygenase [Paraburkholderia sp. NMBU_R16]NRO98882.1 nitronate monooxygenase [Paraburkholderia sp. NMBU_R16]
MTRLAVTAICRDLGAHFPIFGFSHEPDVVVALAEAGGFGVLGLAREMPHEIPQIIERIEARLAGKPYGIDLMLPANVPRAADIDDVRTQIPPEHRAFVEGLRVRFGLREPTRPSFFTTQVRTEALFDAQIEAVLASNARAVATAIGIRPDLIARARAAGKYTLSLVGTTRHAHKALELGVDALVAQGCDAGGHTGTIGTFSLVPQIVALARGKPVLAAGGIGTGAQIAASLAMGAQGAWLGTLWLAAAENHTPPALLERLIHAQSGDTLITRAHSGKPCRVVRSAWIDAWHEAGAPGPLPLPLQQALTGADFSAMHEYDDANLIYEAAGQSVFAITRPTTVAAQMATLIEEANAAFDALQRALN